MTFLLDYQNRVQEINEYLEFVFVIDKSTSIDLENVTFPDTERLEQLNLLHLKDNSTYTLTSDLKKTLKANAYLLLYNLIEGSVMAGIDAILLAVNQSDKELRYFKKEIRSLYLDYSMARNDEDSNLKAKDRKNLRGQLNSLIDQKVVFRHKNKDNSIIEGYIAYQDKVSKGEISGNVDLSVLTQLSMKYDFILPHDDVANELSIIKNKRNQLAHGEITFAEAGQEKSIEELMDMKSRITNYFNTLMQNIKGYIDNEEFIM